MKLILFIIFSIIDFNLISYKYLKPSDIFKGRNSDKNFNPKNKNNTINSTNYYNPKDQDQDGNIADKTEKAPLFDIFDNMKGIEEQSYNYLDLKNEFSLWRPA